MPCQIGPPLGLGLCRTPRSKANRTPPWTRALESKGKSDSPLDSGSGVQAKGKSDSSLDSDSGVQSKSGSSLDSDSGVRARIGLLTKSAPLKSDSALDSGSVRFLGCCCSVLAARCAAAAAARVLQLLKLLLLLLKLLLLLLLLRPYCCSCCSSLASCLLLHLLPRSPPAVRCSFFAFSSLLHSSFSTSCCFLAFGRFSLVPSEGPLISDQLRRGPLLFLRYFSSTYSYLLLACSPPPLPPPPSHCLTTSRCLRRQLFPTFADNKSLSHAA
jgi:hypothetical protein